MAVMARPSPNLPDVVARRRWLALVLAAGGLVGFAPVRAARPERSARALPPALHDLDAAALALVRAADAARWADADRAIGAAEHAARAVGDLQASYTRAGGELSRYFAATNQLAADLIDARTAASVRDRAWLARCADDLVTRAGDLTQPYAAGIDEPAPRLVVLFAFARRMERAPEWQDTDSFTAARRDFDRLWPAVRAGLAHRLPQRVKQVDAARAHIALAASSADTGALSQALHDLLRAIAAA
jgi:hypothetical protein